MMLKMSLLKGEREFQDVADVFHYPFDANGQTLQSPAVSCIRSARIAPQINPLFFHLPLGGVILPGQAKNHLFSFLLSNSCRDRRVSYTQNFYKIVARFLKREYRLDIQSICTRYDSGGKLN